MTGDLFTAFCFWYVLTHIFYPAILFHYIDTPGVYGMMVTLLPFEHVLLRLLRI